MEDGVSTNTGQGNTVPAVHLSSSPGPIRSHTLHSCHTPPSSLWMQVPDAAGRNGLEPVAGPFGCSLKRPPPPLPPGPVHRDDFPAAPHGTPPTRGRRAIASPYPREGCGPGSTPVSDSATGQLQPSEYQVHPWWVLTRSRSLLALSPNHSLGWWCVADSCSWTLDAER